MGRLLPPPIGIDREFVKPLLPEVGVDWQFVNILFGEIHDSIFLRNLSPQEVAVVGHLQKVLYRAIG